MMNSFVFLELDEFISHTCGIILTNVALKEYSRKLRPIKSGHRFFGAVFSVTFVTVFLSTY